MASLITRSSTFYAQFYDGDRSPQRKRISLRTENKSTARALLSQFERLHLTGEIDVWTDDPFRAVQPDQPKAERVTLSEAFSQFMDARREMGCTANTLRTYRETVGWLIDDTGAEKPLKAFTPACVRMRTTLATATGEKRYRVLRTFLRYHECAAQVLESVEKPRPERKLPVACSRARVRSLRRSVTP